MTNEGPQRFVLLNRLVSRSATRAPEEHKPPMIPGAQLLEAIERRRSSGSAIEFLGLVETERDAEKGDKARIRSGKGHDFILLRQMKFEERSPWKFATLLLEFVDESRRSFSVVHTQNLTGREIAGADEERGSRSTHMVVRLPIKQYDDGSYRCAIEVAHSIPRNAIEHFLCRQLRRQAAQDGLTFGVKLAGKKGKSVEREYRYNPKLELFADIGRKIDFALSGGRELAHMTFTKRSEKQSIGKPTTVAHQDLYADVELKVSAKQGPEGPAERIAWLSAVRSAYEMRGYETRMYYRHLNGGILSGQVHHALAGATDLVMCQKELISLKREPKEWYPKIDNEINEQMITLLSTDDLWERTK